MGIDDRTEWQRVDDALAQSLELPAEARAAWLREELGDATHLSVRAVKLVTLHDRNEEFSRSLTSLREQVFDDLVSELGSKDGDPRIGAVYGVWRVVRLIGVGGHSVVYEAARADGRYDQKVALKVMRNGISRGSVTRQLLRERQILSRLEHPGIARMIDGGETSTGAPWLVMELVEGSPITQYCEFNDVPLSERFGLLASVCDAVQAAHSRLIVHRDIKPDNILVEPEGRPRLLDFGISRFVDGDDEEALGLALTPGYASPEQERGESPATPSDIFQLGLVLRDLTADFDRSPQVAAVLDRALQSDPKNRYQSATALGDDLRKLQSGLAPMARPDTGTEAALRLVRRHWAASALIGLLFFGIVGWAVSTSNYNRALQLQRSVAMAEAARAESSARVLLDLFRRADPLQRDGVTTGPTLATSLLEPALYDIRTRLADDPLLRSRLIAWVAVSRQRRGDDLGALALAQEALDGLSTAGLKTQTAYASALALVGAIESDLGDQVGGGAKIDTALTVALAANLDDSDALDVVLIAGWAKDADPERRRQLFANAVERAKSVSSIGAEIEARSGLARALAELGETTTAEAEIRDVIALTETTFGKDHQRLALPLSDLGRLLTNSNRPDEGAAAHRRALDIARAAPVADPGTLVSHLNNLAIALMESGQVPEAIRLQEENIEVQSSLNGADSLSVAEMVQNLAVMQAKAGETSAALRSLDRAETIFDSVLPSNHPRQGFPALTRAEILLDAGRFGEAERNARRAFDQFSTVLPEGHFATEVARCRIGLARLGLGDRSGAAAFIEPALRALKAQPSVSPRYSAPCQEGAALLGLPY